MPPHGALRRETLCGAYSGCTSHSSLQTRTLRQLSGFLAILGWWRHPCRLWEGRGSLLSEVITLGRKTGASRIELRQERLLASCNDISAFFSESSRKPLQFATKSNKVRMLLNLPDSSEMLMKSFKSKLRSQITKL